MFRVTTTPPVAMQRHTRRPRPGRGLMLLPSLFTAAALLAAACAPAAPPSPTAAPAKPAEAAKPAEVKPAATTAPAKPTEAPAAKPAEAKPAASPAAKPAEAKPAEKPAAAASPAAKAEAKPAASPAAFAKPATRVKIVSQELTPVPDPTYSFNDIAIELGFADKYNIDLVVQRGGGAHSIKVAALISGQADIAMTDIIGAMSSVYEGTDMRVLFVPSARYGAAVVATDKYSTPEQLRGKQVGVPTLAGSARFLSILTFKHFGMGEKDIQWLAVGPTNEAVPALAGGRVDAAVLTPLAIPLLRAMPEAVNTRVVIDNTARYTPPFPNFVMIARNQWVQQNPEAAERYVEMMLDLSRHLATDQSGWARVANKLFPTLSLEDAAASWKIFTDAGLWAENGGINLAGTQQVLDLYFEVRGDKPNDKLAKAADTFNVEPLRKVLARKPVLSSSKDVPDWYRP